MNIFINKIIVDINVFSMRVGNRIINKSYIVLIISVNDSSCNLSKVKLSQQCLKPDSFLHSICKDNILGFNRKSDHSLLLLRIPLL